MMPRVLIFWLVAAVAVVAQAAKPGAGEYRIAGVVYDSTSGQTLPGARVSLGRATSKEVPNRTVLTGPDGSFAFDHLAPGKYQMFGEAAGFPQQGFEQHEAPYLTGVVVGAGAPADKLVFRLQRGCAISGTVTDEFNDPVRDARVLILRKGLQNGRFTTGIYRNAQTDDQGFYKAAPLLPGAYFVAVSARPWYAQMAGMYAMRQDLSPQAKESMRRLDTAFPLTFYSGATEASDASEITLRNGERTTADVVVHSVPAVQVRVQSAPTQKLLQPQNPIPYVRLTQKMFGDEEEQAFTIFSEQRRSPEGDEIVTGIAPGHYVAHLVRPGSEDERTRELDITGDMSIDPETFGSGATTSVHGLVQVSGGASAPSGLFVQLHSRNGGAPAGEVGPKGEFDIERLQPGTYEVAVGNAEDFFLLDMAATNAKINGRSISISGSAPVSLAVVLGKGTADIHGFAMRDGKGLGGTLVLLVPQNAGANYILFRRDQSDSDGSFTLSRIVPGKYRVIALEDGWDLEWSKPAVLKPYLDKAQEMDVAVGQKYDIKVEVQARRTLDNSASGNR